MTSIAMADAFVCCWDAKYTYWSARPIQGDVRLDVLFPTPPFPSYTSGHATISGAAAAVLGGFFPSDAHDLDARAVEAKNSRLWAGFHYPIDNDVGLALDPEWHVGQDAVPGQEIGSVTAATSSAAPMT